MQSTLAQVSAYVLIIGTFLSYLIQYVKLTQKKTNDGISHAMLITGSLSGATNFIGLITSNWSKNNSTPFLPTFQLFTPWLCITIFYTMYLYYAYKNRFHNNIYNNRESLLWNNNINNILINTNEIMDYKRVRISFPTYLMLTLIFWIIATILKISYNSYIEYYSNIMNVSASITSVAMWIPQIHKSYKLKEAGSLSLIALAIHCAGCVLTVIYQVAMSNQEFLVGLPYLIGAIFSKPISSCTYCIYLK